MKILHIINELSLDGGAENLVKDLVLGINRKGIKTDILVLEGYNRSPVQELRSNGINVISSGPDNIYSLFNFTKIMKLIDKYDIVHTHLFPAQYWYIISKLISRSTVKSVTTEHSTSNRRRNNIIFKYPEKFIYSKYDRIICISKGTEESLLDWIPSISKKTITIHNGIDINRFRNCQPYERKLLVPEAGPDSKLILMVARMSIQKDFETLISAAKLLPQEYHIILVGEGPKMGELKKLACELGISDRIQFLGIRDDVNRIMKSVDLFVLSSNWEGFGLVAIEAMASGLPVIASDVKGLSEIVKGYGLLFNKGDFQELARIIQDITLEKVNYKIVSERCKKRADDFGIDKVVDSYIEVYKELMQV